MRRRPPRSGAAPPPAAPSHDVWVTIESIDLEGQGVAHDAEGRVVFVEGALPGEEVCVRIERSKMRWSRGTAVEWRRESPLRVVPRCPHFGVCGGCKTQHFDVDAQLAVKQRVLEDGLAHVGKVKPALVLRPIAGSSWGYRHRARLSVFYLEREDRMLIGFHGRKSSHVVGLSQCPVMPKAMSDLLMPLQELLHGMDQRERVPQIEVAVGARVIALVLRHLQPLSDADLQRLRDFAGQHGVQWWLQPKGPDTAHPLDPEAAARTLLDYELPEFGIRMPYRPTDFTQVNPDTNRALVSRAMGLLEPQPHERVIDWFCGLGNFSLPIARGAREVLGVEGSASLVAQARANAALHGLSGKTDFKEANLFEIDLAALMALGVADKWLVDPPRDGAFALAKALADWHERAASMPAEWVPPKRIVYVSCDPSTLARDAGLLVHRAGYECKAAGVINMFPHTAHVESMAVFERA